MNKKIKPRSRVTDILMQEVVGEVMIYDLETNRAFLLNPTSSKVWQLCNGNRTVAEIASLVSEDLDSPVPEDLVWLALDQFKQEKLLANDELNQTAFLRVSRREVVRKVGLGTMVALPLISSIVVPFSVEGASCFPDAFECVSPADCCSNCCYTECGFGSFCQSDQSPESCLP